MYEYENKETDNKPEGTNNGEYRYTGPFYQDNYNAQNTYHNQNNYGNQNGYAGQTSYHGAGYSGSGLGEVKKTKKKNKFFPLMTKVICVALVFGVIASAAFQTTNYFGKKVFGDEVVTPRPQDPTATTLLPKVESTEVKNSGGAVDLSPVADIAERCLPSLVAITNVSVVEIPDYYSNFYWYFFGGKGGGTQQQEQTSTGTGIVIGMNDTELLIVTNEHVISGATTLTVVFSMDEGKEEAKAVEARIKGADESKDLGVIAVKLEDIPAETLAEIKVATIGDSSSLRVGEQVVAIGNALGYGQSVTTGIVSALGRDISLVSEDGVAITNSLIQTDAAINPGNSGGALLNMRGEVIGINEAKYQNSGVEGMGYAIPISDVESIISDLSLRITRDKVAEEDRGFLGISCQDVTSEVSQMYGMPVGIFVSSVTEGSGAAKAGIKKGDIIVRFDGVMVSNYNELQEQLSCYEAGETVEIVVKTPQDAEYVEKTVQVTLTTRKAAGVE